MCHFITGDSLPAVSFLPLTSVIIKNEGGVFVNCEMKKYIKIILLSAALAAGGGVSVLWGGRRAYPGGIC